MTSTCFYFHRKAIIPIEIELAEDKKSDNSQSENEDEDPNLECYIKKMNDFRDELFKKAKDEAQMKQKCNYDRKLGKRKVQNCSGMSYHFVCKQAVLYLYFIVTCIPIELDISTGIRTRSIGAAM